MENYTKYRHLFTEQRRININQIHLRSFRFMTTTLQRIEIRSNIIRYRNTLHRSYKNLLHMEFIGHKPLISIKKPPIVVSHEFSQIHRTNPQSNEQGKFFLYRLICAIH